MLQHTDSYPTQHQWVITQSFAASDCLISWRHDWLWLTFYSWYSATVNRADCVTAWWLKIKSCRCMRRRMLQHEFPVLYRGYYYILYGSFYFLRGGGLFICDWLFSIFPDPSLTVIKTGPLSLPKNMLVPSQTVCPSLPIKMIALLVYLWYFTPGKKCFSSLLQIDFMKIEEKLFCRVYFIWKHRELWTTTPLIFL